MDIREVVHEFTAMDGGGHPYTIPRCAMLFGFGDSCGFSGRVDDITTLVSFVYMEVLYYARRKAVEIHTKPMVFTSGRKRKAASS